MKIVAVLPQIGDKIKCLDFVGNECHWVCGEVKSIGYTSEGWMSYEYTCTDASDSNDDLIGSDISSAVGTSMEDEISGRVAVLHEGVWYKAITGRVAIEVMNEEMRKCTNT